jgi:dihydroxy-acid dehydratase
MEKFRQAKETGYRIVELVRDNLRFSDLVTTESIQDAVRLVMALSAGTNGLLHLLSLAKSMELEIDIDTFDFLSDDTPYYCPVRPSGPFTVVDLHEAGGVLAVLKRVRDKLHPDRPTVARATIGELVDGATIVREEVILPAARPIYPTGGIKVLRGNLAPDGSLCRYTISGQWRARSGVHRSSAGLLQPARGHARYFPGLYSAGRRSDHPLPGAAGRTRLQ